MVNNLKHSSAWQRALAVFSLNDPQWGRGETLQSDKADADVKRHEPSRPPDDKPGRRDGPPDLDELWRDFNKRLNRLLGRKGGGGAPAGDKPRSPRANAYGVLAALAVIALVWLGSGLYIVQEGQAGVVLRFGRYVYTTPAGVQWRAPYPFESNVIVNMSQVRSIEIGRNGTIRATNLKDSSMLTADGNIIDVRFAVQYRIKDAADFLFNNADAEANVAQAAETAVREIVGASNMDYVLYEGREKVALDLAQSIQRILDSYVDGILVTSVTMQSVQPPQQVQAAFDDAVKAGQDRERQKNEAQAYANDVVPRARGTAARMLEEAEGYRARVVARAEGDASRFNAIQAAYAKAPAITRERIYLQTMQDIYANTSKVLVDSKSNSLIYLPLDKLMAQSGARGSNGAVDGPTGGTANGAPSPGSNGGDGGSASNDTGASFASGDDAANAAARATAGDAGNDPLRSRSLFRSRGRSEALQDVR